MIEWIIKIGLSVGVLVITFFASTAVGLLIKHRAKNSEEPGREQALGLIAKVSGQVIWVIGILTALGTLGVNINALIASLGLTSFALGFALKDAISNILGGFLILFYQPFRYNDEVKVSGHQGIVKEINLRYTRLETEEGQVLIPNGTLLSTVVVLLNQKT